MLGEFLPTDSDSRTRKVRAARGLTSHPIEFGAAPVSSSSRHAITVGNESVRGSCQVQGPACRSSRIGS
jgi:hypothetical protein